jgi:GntR family transcriptional regulator, transcriptional repressor for pyruvate dehydrogenase complex
VPPADRANGAIGVKNSDADDSLSCGHKSSGRTAFAQASGAVTGHDGRFGPPLQQPKLHETVAGRIRELVLSESLRPGERLPSERHLASLLRVSRVVVREALRVLAVRGMVDVRPGRGTFIKQVEADHAIESLGLFLRLRRDPRASADLLDVRDVLEMAIAERAARNASPEDLLELEDAIASMVEHRTDGDEFVGHDLTFHLALARATHNELFLVLLTPITDRLLEVLRASYSFDPVRASTGGIAHHQAILARVRAGDVAGTRAAMKEHLRQARETIETFERKAGARG